MEVVDVMDLLDGTSYFRIDSRHLEFAGLLVPIFILTSFPTLSKVAMVVHYMLLSPLITLVFILMLNHMRQRAQR